MNLYLVRPNIVKFNIWNLLAPVSGHFTFYYHLETKQYVFHQMGDYGSLTSIVPVAGILRHPTPAEKKGFRSYIRARLRSAYHYDGGWHAGGCRRPLLAGNKSKNVGGYTVFDEGPARTLTPSRHALNEAAVAMLTDVIESLPVEHE